MKYELTAPMYILFAELANFEVDTDQRLDQFLKENIEPAKGISKKYILDTLEQAFLDGETLNVKLVRKEVLIRNCLEWIRKNREGERVTESLTYEKLFKNQEDCIRITNVILKQGCIDGIFTGFRDTLGTPRNQILIAYDIIKDSFLDHSIVDAKGRREAAKCIFLEHFGWHGFRDSKSKEGGRLINMKKSSVDYSTEPNREAKIDLKLFLK